MIYISDSSQMLDSVNTGDVVECMPSKVYGNSLTVDHDSFVRKIDDDKSIATLSDLRIKISDVKPENDYCVSCMTKPASTFPFFTANGMSLKFIST